MFQWVPTMFLSETRSSCVSGVACTTREPAAFGTKQQALQNILKSQVIDHIAEEQSPRRA